MQNAEWSRDEDLFPINYRFELITCDWTREIENQSRAIYRKLTFLVVARKRSLRGAFWVSCCRPNVVLWYARTNCQAAVLVEARNKSDAWGIVKRRRGQRRKGKKNIFTSWTHEGALISTTNATSNLAGVYKPLYMMRVISNCTLWISWSEG